MIKVSNGNVEVGGNGMRIMMDYSLLTTTILEAMTKEVDEPEEIDVVVKLLTNAFAIGIDAFHEGRKHAGTEESLQA